MTSGFLLGLFVPLIFFPILIYCEKIGNFTGLIDKPNFRKVHKKPTSKIGGVFFIIVIVFLLITNYSNFNERLLLSMFILSFGLFAIGLIDDLIDIKGSTRLILQFFVIAISIIIDFNLNINELYLGYNSLEIKIFTGSFIFSIFCIITLVNDINLADGENGLVVSIFLIFLIIFYYNHFDPINAIFIPLILSCILFLTYNIKGLVFLGNSGSYLIGGLISFITIQSYNFNFIPVEEIFLLFSLYGLDMLRVYLERILRKIHPFTAEKNHLHHYIYKTSESKLINLLIYLAILYLPYGLNKLYENYLIWFLFSILIYFFSLYFFKKLNKDS